MARLNSFYLEPNKWVAPYFLDQEEALHFSKVLRGKVGEIIRVFNGQGKEGLFKVLKIDKKKVYLEPLEIKENPTPTSKIHLALAWQKASKRDLLLEKSVELKCWKISFWPGKYSPPYPKQKKESWQKKLINAAKQCQNPWLPQITLENSLEDLLNKPLPQQKLFFWEKEKNNLLSQVKINSELIVVIGPEGGLAPVEVNTLLKNNFQPISLGSSILRLETAMLIGIGFIYLHLENQINK